MSEENKTSIELKKNSIPDESVFNNIVSFENAHKIAKELSQSSLVPEAYQNNVSNTMVAMEMATRVGISPIFVMQNLHIIRGKPSWSSSFIIASINSCGRFSPLKFVFEGDKGTDDFGCRAIANEVKTGEELKGTLVSWKMVKAEGWFSKKDKRGNETSKWQTLPELMFQYRAAAFFGRVHCPELLHGMHTKEEMIDIPSDVVVINATDSRKNQEDDRLRQWIEGCETMENLKMIENETMSKDNQKLFMEKEESLKGGTSE